MNIALGLLRWWYGEGLLKQLLASRESVSKMVDFFSITLLLKTLFSPFRQISAGQVRGPLGVQIRAWLDKLISRCVGATIRSLTIILGVFALGFSVIMQVLRLAGWIILPLMPIFGLILMLIGWVPWNT
jgi:hypothetical protein